MIKKVQTRFILLTLSALFIVLFIIIAGINIVNYESVVQDADQLLALLSTDSTTFLRSRKELPFEEKPDHDFQERELEKPSIFDLTKIPSPETPYESRFFSVSLDPDTGSVLDMDLQRIAFVDSSLATEYAQIVYKKNKTNGFLYDYRYLRCEEEDHIKIIFLDCKKSLDSFYTFVVISAGISSLGFLIVSLIVIYFSNRIIRPISESYEKQKRFITDASHDIKTPLTIINADADILEMDLEDNEWLADIKKQTRRLTELTNNLVLLTRMEESEKIIQRIDFPISDVAAEAAQSFFALAQTQDKTIDLKIQPLLTFCGDSIAIHQLITLLLDNAIKYSPPGEHISFVLEQKNKQILLSVTNKTENLLSFHDVNLLFDRFYRTDTSRNSETGGYGIGLSVAKAIVSSHNGKIKILTPSEREFQIIVQLPILK